MDLIDLGKYFSKGKDIFGKNTKDNDLLLPIQYMNNQLNIKPIIRKRDMNLSKNISNKSIFSEDLYIITDQRIMIPSNSNMRGLTPFFLELKEKDFIKKNERNEDGCKKFKQKIKRSLDANHEKEFIKELQNFYEDPDIFLNCTMRNNDDIKNIHDFLENHSFESVKSVILDYYTFLDLNSELIINNVIDYIQSDNYDKKDKSNFYILCFFNNDFDLLNDMFYYFSKFLKKRNETPDFQKGICSVCGEKTITLPLSGMYVQDKMYFFNFEENVKNSKLRLCQKCNSYISLAEDKLKNSFTRNIMIIPKLKKSSDDEHRYKEFNEIITDNDLSSIKKINNILDINDDKYNYDLLIYTREQGDSYPIRHYIENYKAYKVKFDKISLVEHSNENKYYLNYLFDEEIGISKKQIDYYQFNNILDLERIFKNFFISINDGSIKNLQKFYYFYQVHTEDMKDIVKNVNSKTATLFSKYKFNIFSYLYELNTNALNKNIIKEIVENCIYELIKGSDSKTNHSPSIKQHLNEYYMIMIELWKDNNMIKNEDIKELKELLDKYALEEDDSNESEETINKIISLVNKKEYTKYYFIGQFIRLIDNTKHNNGKNAETFKIFITNSNRNNIKKIFSTEILQKNIHYIERMNKKGKLVFNIIETNMETLFNENDLIFEDYILALTTGYYTKNLLKSNKKGE